jgi:hypothetical protein
MRLDSPSQPMCTGSAGADEFAFSVLISSVSSSITKAWARGRGRYRGVLQSPHSASGADDGSSGCVERAHLDTVGGAHTAVQDCAAGPSRDSAPRSESHAQRPEIRPVVLAGPSPSVGLSTATQDPRNQLSSNGNELRCSRRNQGGPLKWQRKAEAVE